MNPFGPQNANASFVNTKYSLRYGTNDTWAKDCSINGNNDGTVLDASFHNMIIGNLGYLVKTSGITGQNFGDMTLVYSAVQSLVLKAGNGLVLKSGTVLSAVGTGTLYRIT